LADGYYGETLSIDMTVYVPWSTPPCPTLTVTTYVGEFGHIHLDSASFSASSYGNGACIYEVQRSVTLSPDAVGLWYDEARARDKAVAIKVSFSLPVSEVKIYRVDISGRRFTENYIDKDVAQWRSLVLRGFFSLTLRACGTARVPQVNYTVAVINVTTYSVVWADILAVGVSGGYVVKGVRFRVKPAVAFEGVNSVYVKGDEFGESWRSTWVYEFKESWWTAWAFKLSQAVKTVLDFFGLISGPLSWFINRVFDLRDLTKPDMTISLDTGSVEWRAGIFDKFHQVAFEIDGSTRDRVIEVVDVRVGTDSTHLCMRSPITSPMPAVDLTALPDLQYLRHWVFGMRVTHTVAFVER
jgi:hypothetical protein